MMRIHPTRKGTNAVDALVRKIGQHKVQPQNDYYVEIRLSGQQMGFGLFRGF